MHFNISSPVSENRLFKSQPPLLLCASHISSFFLNQLPLAPLLLLLQTTPFHPSLAPPQLTLTAQALSQVIASAPSALRALSDHKCLTTLSGAPPLKATGRQPLLLFLFSTLLPPSLPSFGLYSKKEQVRDYIVSSLDKDNGI